MENTEYTLRRLQDDDLWPVVDIAAKLIPEDLTSAFTDIMAHGKSVDEVGKVVVARLITAVLKNMRHVKEEVYAFLSDVSGLPAETIKGMAFGTTPKMIWDIVRNEKNADFFAAVSKSFE